MQAYFWSDYLEDGRKYQQNDLNLYIEKDVRLASLEEESSRNHSSSTY